jgi:hypothetical protein
MQQFIDDFDGEGDTHYLQVTLLLIAAWLQPHTDSFVGLGNVACKILRLGLCR